MSNPSKDHTSIRVHAPPGGHSNNIFGTSEFEQSAANKKKHMESDIFGSKKDNVDPAPAKPVRNAGNNIFGTDPEENNTKPGTIAGQYKQTQMRSNIFGNDEPTTGRHVSDKNRSDIFGVSNDDQNKRQGATVRQGLRVGYNPINGEAYSTNNNNVNSKTTEPENNNTQPAAPTNATENDNAQLASTNPSEPANTQEPAATNTNENGNTQTATNTNENSAAQKPADKPDNTANAQKNVHTSVRVFHPPGGKSNGPLW